jgi:hypothetical protein
MEKAETGTFDDVAFLNGPPLLPISAVTVPPETALIV